MIPADLSVTHAFAVLLLIVAWTSYSVILAVIGRGTLNSQLAVVRRQWIQSISERANKPFDAVLLGHIVHSVAFFGSATLIVLAALFSIIVNLESLHATVTRLHFVNNASLELFAFEVALLALVLAVCFFSFTYGLRKLIYAIALIGALPDASAKIKGHNDLVDQVTTVLTEAVKSFNFGIRGYYYAVSAIFLFISPYACIVATLIATIVLVYRQLGSKTSKAIRAYIEVINSPSNNQE